MNTYEINDLAYSDTQAFLCSQLPDHEKPMTDQLADERAEEEEAERERLEQQEDPS